MLLLSSLAAPEGASASGTPMQPASRSPSKPHIVMVLADDLGWNQVGYQSDGHVSTPHIDALAGSGVRLKRMYAHFICSPSRSALQTGRAPHRANLENYAAFEYLPGGGEWAYPGAPPLYEGLGSVMRRGGYTTHMLGKWHAGMATEGQTPAGRGYDAALVHFTCSVSGWTYAAFDCTDCNRADLWESGGDIPFPGRPASALLNDPHCNRTTAVGWSGAGQCVHVDETLASRTEAIIAAHPLSGPDAKLLFLFLSPHAKHEPHDEPTVLEGCPARPSRTTTSLSGGPSATEAAAPNDIAQLREAAWTTDCEVRMAVTSLDGLVGRVADALQSRAGLWDASLLIFASDNGGYDPLEWANSPLRGFKRTVWEGGIRVAAFASGGFLPTAVRGTVQDGLMCLHDLYATFAALGGVTNLQPAPSDSMFAVDALDMSSLLLGRTTESPRDTVVVANTPCGQERFHECSPDEQRGVVNAVIHRQKNGTLLKLVIGDALVTGHSLTETTACGREANIEGCLYDLIDDEGEKTSLAALRPQDFAQLLAIADAVTVYPRPESGWTNFARQGDSKEERLSMLPPFQPFLDNPTECSRLAHPNREECEFP